MKGLNALIATVSTPLSAPVICATRLRKGSTNSARGAARLVADAIVAAKTAGAGGPDSTGLIILRADSAFSLEFGAGDHLCLAAFEHVDSDVRL